MAQERVGNPEGSTDQLDIDLGLLRIGVLNLAERQPSISEADQTKDLDRLTITFRKVVKHFSGARGAPGPELAPADTALGGRLLADDPVLLGVAPTVAGPRITLRARRKGFLFEDATLDEMRESKGPGAVELLEVMENDAAKDETELAAVERQAIVEIGRWLKRLRDEQNLTQEALAKTAGTTPAQISLLENGIGRRGPSIGLFARVLHGLGLEIVFET